MHLDSFILELTLILVASGVVTLIFKKINQPVVLGYIIAGLLISPNFLDLPINVSQDDVTIWADIGIVFLMFGLGLEFSFKKLAEVGGSAFTIAITVMTMMILVGTSLGAAMGWGRMDCIFLGGMISMSSTMIILKSYDEYNLRKEKFAQLVLGALVIEDIAGIFMLLILSTISVGTNVSGIEMVQELGLMLLYLAIWAIIGIFIVPSFFRAISKMVTDEMLLIISIGFCLLMVVIANFIGFSSALGAFLSGSILAGTVQSERIIHLVEPVKNLFGAVFFVSVGMLIVPSTLIKYIVPIIVISLAVMFGQLVFSTIGIILSGQSLRTAIRGGFSMVQIGEFSFIVATLGMSLGVIGDHLYPIIVCVSVITSFITPVFIKNSEKAYLYLNKHLPIKVRAAIKKNTSENQSSNTTDRDWNQYIKKVTIRTGICSAVLFLLYFLGIRYLDPIIRDIINPDSVGDIITAGVIILLMIPFVNFMHGTNNALFVKLWVKRRSNHLPLITLKVMRVFIAACFVAMVLEEIFMIPFIILVIISVIPLAFVARSSWINGVTIGMEKRFAANFSERTLAKAKKDRDVDKDYRWLNESLFVAEFEIVDRNFEKSVYEFSRRREFVVTIVRIIRGNEIINMPSATEMIKYGDILQMFGTRDEIDACTILLERDHAIEYTRTKDKILKDFIYGQRFIGVPEEYEIVCVPIKLEGNSSYVWKSIRNSGMRSELAGTIIGIERGTLPIVNPDIDTVLRKDDIIWLMGGKKMVDKLIIKGLIE